MEIQGPLPPANSAPRSIGSLLQSLQPGQTISATVTRQLPGGQVELQIGQTRVSSLPPLPLSTGQSLQLRVIGTSPEKIDLRITNALQEVDTLSRAIRENLPRQIPLARALNQAIQRLVVSNDARQSLPAPVRDAFRQLLSNLPDVRKLSQPDSLRQTLERSGARLEAQLKNLPDGKTKTDIAQTDLKANLVRVIQSLRSYAGLRPAQVSAVNTPAGKPTIPAAQAVPASQPANNPVTNTSRPDSSTPNNLIARLLSLLAEDKAATATTLPPTTTTSPTLKTGIENVLNRLPLLNLFRGVVQAQTQTQQPPAEQNPAIRSFVNELILQLESGLARVHLNQLNSLPQNDDSGRSTLILNLPVSNGDKLDDLHVRIEREQVGNNEEIRHIWRVTLHFEFEGLGVIRANIAIHDNQVNTTFHSENPFTSEVFQKHLDDLRQSLDAAGLHTGHLESTHIANAVHRPYTKEQSGFLHTKA